MSRILIISLIILSLLSTSFLEAQEEPFSAENFPTWEEFRKSILTGPRARNYLYQINRDRIWEWIDQNWEQIYFVNRGNPYEIGGSFFVENGKVRMEFIPNSLLTKYARAKKDLARRKRVDPYVLRVHVEGISDRYPSMAKRIMDDVEEFKNDFVRLNRFETRYHRNPNIKISDFGFILRRDQLHFLVMPVMIGHLKTLARSEYRALHELEPTSMAFFHFHPKNEKGVTSPPSPEDLEASASRGPEIVFAINKDRMDVYECVLGESKLLRSYFSL